MKVLSVLSAMATVAVFGATNVATIAHAQAPAPALQFGRVDVRKVLEESKSRVQVTADLGRTQRGYENVLQRLGQGSARFLTDAEILELATLYQTEKPTDVQKKRIGALEEKGDAVKRELTTLQNTQSPDAAQTARYDQISALQSQGTASLQKLSGSLSAKLEDTVREAERKTLDTVRATVAKVAKTKNLSVVFTADMAVYASIDITEDVIKELNK